MNCLRYFSARTESGSAQWKKSAPISCAKSSKGIRAFSAPVSTITRGRAVAYRSLRTRRQSPSEIVASMPRHAMGLRSLPVDGSKVSEFRSNGASSKFMTAALCDFRTKWRAFERSRRSKKGMLAEYSSDVLRVSHVTQIGEFFKRIERAGKAVRA